MSPGTMCANGTWTGWPVAGNVPSSCRTRRRSDTFVCTSERNASAALPERYSCQKEKNEDSTTIAAITTAPSRPPVNQLRTASASSRSDSGLARIGSRRHQRPLCSLSAMVLGPAA
jgi:hypothetical protein